MSEKKKILSINLGNLSSTGGIMHGITLLARESGFDAVEAYPDRFDNYPVRDGDIVIIPDFWRRVCEKLAFITGFNGCFAYFYTRAFLRKVSRFKPDVIHLHNLHNSYINLPLLFKYIKRNKIKTVWTLHECWAFTGQCPYFTLAKCDKWKTGCHDCPSYNDYPRSSYDNSKTMYRLKKKWFTGIEEMRIITNSDWLAGLARQSFLKDYPIRTIHNGIDVSVFRPTESDFRKKHGLEDKFIVLGVSFSWGRRKGLDVIPELAKGLDDRFQIILVGTDDEVDSQLPDNVMTIHRTGNRQEMVEIYSAADVFVNPTREEAYPTVNLEAIACGTPVITFDSDGAPEMITPENGIVVHCDDVPAMTEAVKRACLEHLFDSSVCAEQGRQFSGQLAFAQYIETYRDILGIK